MRTKLIAGSAVLIVAVIFIIQNAHSVNIRRTRSRQMTHEKRVSRP
jgi:uncharacterized integral membrane protein